MIIDKNLLDQVSTQAKESPRLRMNYNSPICFDKSPTHYE